jgi:hypothetical protein
VPVKCLFACRSIVHACRIPSSGCLAVEVLWPYVCSLLVRACAGTLQALQSKPAVGWGVLLSL